MEESLYIADHCISYIQYWGLVCNCSDEADVPNDLQVIPEIQRTCIQYKQ